MAAAGIFLVAVRRRLHRGRAEGRSSTAERPAYGVAVTT
jgi:hypothetical protein